MAGLADANGQPGDPVGSIKSLFDTGETFKHVEIGWYDTWENRFRDNFHLSAWQIDARSAAGVDSGWGVAVSGSPTLAERWTPFFRAGYADGGGGPVERSVSVGTGYTLFGARDQLGVGLNWGRAPQGTNVGQPRDQYTTDVFYRYQPFTVPRALLGVMIAEWLATGRGLGNLLNQSRGYLDFGMIWTVAFVSVLLSVVLYQLVVAIERKVLRRLGMQTAE